MTRRALALLLPALALACGEAPVSPATTTAATPDHSVSVAVTPVVLTGTSSYSSGSNHVVFATERSDSWDDIRIVHGTTVITENFNTGTWNATNFELANVNNPGSAASGAYQSTGAGGNNRGGLRTVQQFAPSVTTPLRIEATYTSASSASFEENIAFLGWRNTGLPGGPNGESNEPANGLLLRIHNFISGYTMLWLDPPTFHALEARPGDSFYHDGPVRVVVTDDGTNVVVTISPVPPLSSEGFLSPVSMTATNRIKAGATVPLKFQVLEDETVVTNPAVITNITETPESCTTPGATGVASAARTEAPRYDADKEQFIVNWRAPSTVGCTRVTVTLTGGATFSALFDVRK